VLTPKTGSPHAGTDSKIRITFVEAKFTPESWSEHVSVSVQSVGPVNAPFMVKAPTKYEKSAKPAGACDQQRLYHALPAVPAVAVLSENSVYGVLAEPVVAGFVSPEKDANTFVPHAAVDKITRTALVDAVPLVVHESCRSQLIVSVQSVA
jgi:hypothetical protein